MKINLPPEAWEAISRAEPGTGLIEFFDQVAKHLGLEGLDGVKKVDPTKVKVSQDRWIALVEQDTRGLDRDQAISIGFLWVNKGPSSDPNLDDDTIIVEDWAFVVHEEDPCRGA